MKRLLAILLTISIFTPLFSGDLKKLTLQQVLLYKGEQISKRLPSVSGWHDNNHYYLREKGTMLKVNVKSGKSSPVLVIPKDCKLVPKEMMSSAARTKDLSKFLIAKNDGFTLFLLKENTLKEIIKPQKIKDKTVKPKNPTFSPDGMKIAYTLGADLYVYDISSANSTRFTKDGSPDILNGYASWVYYEEILGRRSRYRAFWWSPNSQYLSFMRFDQTDVPEFHLYGAKGDYGYTETNRYPKPGYPNPTVKIGVADLSAKDVKWIDFKDEKEHYLTLPLWNPKSNKVLFQWMNRGQDHFKILAYDLKTASISPLFEEKQKAWVDFISTSNFHMLKNDDLVIKSAKDGWFHVYYIPVKGQTRQLTSGDWSISSIQLVDEKKKRIYFTAKKEDSTQTDLYLTGFKGKKIKRLTSDAGSHRVTLSPNGRYFLDRFSSVTTASRLDLRDNRGKLIRKLGDSYSDVIEKYEISKAKKELFRIKTDDGYNLPALWILPPNLDKSKKYPVVISIYGGPNAASVSNRMVSRNKLFLAQEGIISISVDHRGSGHFGKKGMDQMHRQLGKWEMNDYITVAKYLRTLPFVDKNKIGITGYSYGGYVTAYAMTFGSEHFNYGISGSPVTDWKLYDSVYTERYMDTPQQNPEGYKNGSALTHVDKYKGNMRLTHGTMDDNVHPQNAIQLLTKILESGKTVELMLYPGSRHGIRGKQRAEFGRSTLHFWLKHFFNRSAWLQKKK